MESLLYQRLQIRLLDISSAIHELKRSHHNLLVSRYSYENDIKNITILRDEMNELIEKMENYIK